MQAKKIYSIAGIALLAVLVVAGVMYIKHVHLQSPLVILPQPGQYSNNSKLQPVPDLDDNGSFNSLQEVSGGTATDQITYDQAAATYHTTHLVFDPNCRVTPVTLAIPPKSVVMLDNQSKWQRSVIIGPRTYTIMPYDYVLAAFNTSGAYGISCDSVQDIGIISVH